MTSPFASATLAPLLVLVLTAPVGAQAPAQASLQIVSESGIAWRFRSIH